MICLSSCVLNIIERQEELIVVRVLASAVLCSPIGENTKQGHLVLLKKRQHSVIEDVSRCDRHLLHVHLGTGHLRIRINERMLIDLPNALYEPNVVGVFPL